MKLCGILLWMKIIMTFFLWRPYMIPPTQPPSKFNSSPLPLKKLREFWKIKRIQSLMRKHNMFHVSARAYRAHQSIIVTLSSQTGMIANIGVILACLVSSVEPLNLWCQESPSVTMFTVESSNLSDFSWNHRMHLRSNAYKHRKSKTYLTKNSREKHQVPTA